MKKNLYSIFLLAFILISGSLFAHQDFWLIQDCDNIKVRIKTGYYYEEINKIEIICELAQKLANELDYTNQIFLDFDHDYTNHRENEFSISFDKGGSSNNNSDDNYSIPILTEESIVIRQISRQFDVLKTLILVEYAINNITKIKSNQIIDSLRLNKISMNQISIELQSMILQKIFRPEEDFKYGFSYYYKGNQFVLFYKSHDSVETDIKTFDNIYHFKRLENSSVILFDSDSSFYFVSMNGENMLSKRQVIENNSGHYKPYSISKIGNEILSFHYYFLSKDFMRFKQRTLIYLIYEDKLIQDIDKLIESEFNK